ncbi:hypothetical protein [Clostridium kluyveri]|uniref:Resolvase HTH domain-containing protein n=2 Tax=Clostridium kluyveri TaxID=1534 RepID=A5N7D2_CLOK5|nr:hypothetical protein [Clostridium kluyveri]EDK33213.1 Conserved hypothetical protein [Clostridium kluyveri DSM 555]BAH06120.1 hypothetical protein CKR_1069 [Clostridium kluyveri NBRC 12016]
MNLIILMIIMGILLIVLNLNAVIKEKKSFQHQLTVKQNNMEDYRAEIAKIKKEFSETILKLHEEIESLRYERKNPAAEVMLYNGRGQKITENIGLDNNEADNNSRYNPVDILENKNGDIYNENIIVKQPEEYEEFTSGGQERETGNNVKIHKIRELLKEGMSINEVSEKTGIDKGEVLLIKELYTE